MSLKVGSILQQRYRIAGVLGQGGMGAVYQAFDINLGVEVAVKENLFTTAEYARQFEREARILASLRHPNLPRVTDHFVIEEEGQYLVMDFIKGVDLRERLEREGSVPEEEALPWFLEICDALVYLHSQRPPVLHRDVKPGNIKITPDGKAMLVDFGLAKVAEQGGATTTGAKAMTPGFSPPEQYGTGRTDTRTDVYSLGATLFAALTATIPEDSIERAMGREKLTPMHKLNPSITPAIARVVEKALAVSPGDRYQSTGEMANALASATGSSRPTLARTYPYLEHTVVSSGKPIPTSRVTRSLQQTFRSKPRMPVVAFLGITLGIIALILAILSAPFLGPRLAAIFAPSNTKPSSIGLPSSAVTEIQPTATTGSVDQTPTPMIEPSDVPTEEPTPSSPAGGTETVASLPTATATGGGIGQIAYVSNKTGKPQIYYINIDGTGEQWLTNQPEGACQPAWSPDGMRLVFTSPCMKNQDEYQGSSLWMITLDGEGNVSDPEPLPIGTGGNYDPVWDPDGNRIAFTSLRDGRAQVYVVDLEMGGLVNLNKDLGHNRQPTWSPTGTQLMFATSRGGDWAIWVMPDNGDDEERRFSRPVNAADSNPDWSRDGQLILFERRKADTPPFLVAARFEDRGYTDSRICYEGKLAGLPMAEPRWSPDGNWIAFETWADGVNHNIAIITSSCTQYVELTSDPGWDFDVAWRPVR